MLSLNVVSVSRSGFCEYPWNESWQSREEHEQQAEEYLAPDTSPLQSLEWVP